jgi:hypothetical protein
VGLEKQSIAPPALPQGLASSNTAHLSASAFPSSVTGNAALGRLRVDPFTGLAGGYNTSLTWRQQGPYTTLATFGA